MIHRDDDSNHVFEVNHSMARAEMFWKHRQRQFRINKFGTIDKNWFGKSIIELIHSVLQLSRFIKNTEYFLDRNRKEIFTMKSFACCLIAFIHAVFAKDLCQGLDKFSVVCDAEDFAGSYIKSKGFLKPKSTMPSDIKQYGSSLRSLYANGCSAVMERKITDPHSNEGKEYMVSCVMEPDQGNQNINRMSCSNHGFQGTPGIVELDILVYDDDNVYVNGRFTSATIWTKSGAEQILEAFTNKCKMQNE